MSHSPLDTNDFAGYYPTAHLRWADSESGDEKPRASIAGWPESGPSHYKLQQLWVSVDENDPPKWRDVEVFHG
jgi:hypothetical protein